MKNILRFYKYSFGFKIGFINCIAIIIVSGISISFLYYQMKGMLIRSMGERLVQVGKTGTYLFSDEDRENIKKIKAFIEEKSFSLDNIVSKAKIGFDYPTVPNETASEIIEMPEYKKIVHNLRQIKYASKNEIGVLKEIKQEEFYKGDEPVIKYAYIWVKIPSLKDKTIYRFVADADYEPLGDEVGILPGDVFKVESFEQCFSKAFNGIPSYNTEFSQEMWGVLLNSATPIYDKNGEVIAVLGLDFRANNEAGQIKYLFWISFFLFLTISGVTIVFSVYLGNHFSSIFKDVAQITEKIKNRNFAVNFDLKRDDEIGSFSQIFNVLISEIKKYTDEKNHEVDKLRDYIPICASCKSIRNDKGYWEQLEKYISENYETEFTHGLCPKCAKKLYGIDSSE